MSRLFPPKVTPIPSLKSRLFFSSSDIILYEVEFVARLVMDCHQLLNGIVFLLELRDLLPLVESQHASIEQLVIFLD